MFHHALFLYHRLTAIIKTSHNQLLMLRKAQPQSLVAKSETVNTALCTGEFMTLRLLRPFSQAEDIGSVVNGNGITRSTLRLVATNSSIVQCVEHNPSAARKIEKNSYSKYAFLQVLKRKGN